MLFRYFVKYLVNCKDLKWTLCPYYSGMFQKFLNSEFEGLRETELDILLSIIIHGVTDNRHECRLVRPCSIEKKEIRSWIFLVKR